MFESLSRGWAMTKASFRVLSLDKEILVLPLMSGAILAAVLGGIWLGYLGPRVDSGVVDGPSVLLAFLLYFFAYAVMIFFNAAVIEMATIRFNGGDPVVKDGLKKSWSKLGRILQWAAVAATVGLILSMLRQIARDRESFLGQILAGLVETAWTVMTFFAVPIAIYQDVGPIQAIKGSVGRVKRTFGESVTGMVSTSLVFFVLGLIGLIPFYLGMTLGGAIGYAMFAIAIAWWVLMTAMNVAIDGILVAALYKYSTDGNLPDAYAQQGVDPNTLAW